MRIRILLGVFCVAGMAPLMSVRAGDLLECLHRHGSASDCCPQQTVVRLPAQEIHVETMRPRVVVNEVVAVPSRHQRGVAAVPVPMMFAQPIMAQPMVATILQPAVAAGPPPSTASNAIRAYSEMMANHCEVVSERARMKAQMDFLDSTHKQMMQTLSASAPVGSGMSSSDCAAIQKSLDDLTKKCGDMERLLLIHDQLLRDQVKK